MRILKKIINRINRKFIIKYIIWDFDGTLYESKILVKNLEKHYFNYINKHKKINKKEFKKLLKKHKKFSLVASSYLNEVEDKIRNDISSNFKTSLFLKKNKKIVKWIENMDQYQHIILSNSDLKNIKDGLIKIGFKKNGNQIYPFKKILGKDNLEKIKPNKKAYEEVKKITKKSGFKHLMIGDSWDDDIKGARKSGFQAIHINRVKDFFS